MLQPSCQSTSRGICALSCPPYEPRNNWAFSYYHSSCFLSKFASAKDITNLAEKIRELDKNRRNDLKVTNKQIDAILKIVKKLAAAPVAPPTQPRNGNDNLPPAKFKFREHTVQAGEFLSTILEAYNSAFKDEGLKGRVTQSQVLKANLGLKANRLLIGQKLRIPEPGEIK